LTAAAMLYLAGGVGVTFAFNVPLNQDLAGLDLATAAPAQLAEARQDYEGTWNAWNTARTVASTAALVCIVAAALSPATPRSRSKRAGARPAPSA